MLTSAQATKVDALKSEWPEFAEMRRLAMTFRGILRSKAVGKLETWLKDLAFDGVTEDLRRLHRLPIQLNSNGAGVGIVSTDAALAM